jgi:hypothetical protein
MNIQPEIKSRCRRLLKEQEMGRREIRKFISKVTDPIKCLKVYDWTFDGANRDVGRWSKTFTLPYPLLVEQHYPMLVEQHRQFHAQQTVIIQLGFTDHYTDLWIMPYPRSESVYHVYVSGAAHPSKSKLIIPLILQKTAIELPKVIASVETKSSYDKAKQKQIEVISSSELIAKIGQVFKEICKMYGAKPT